MSRININEKKNKKQKLDNYTDKLGSQIKFSAEPYGKTLSWNLRESNK